MYARVLWNYELSSGTEEEVTEFQVEKMFIKKIKEFEDLIKGLGVSIF